jgi:uncharacterized protein (TIGR02265 family)
MTTLGTYSIRDPIVGDLDVEAKLKSLPPSFVVKGMFFKRLAKDLAGVWTEVASRLSAPPPGGRYVPFSDYPQSDYFQLIVETARRKYPNVSVREGMRRVARDDFLVFTDSQLGKVVMSAVGESVRAALLKFPEVYMRMAPGDWVVRGEELDGSTVRIEFIPLRTSWEYQLGQLEGMVLHFGVSPTTTVSEPAPRHLCFDVRCG